VYAAVYSLITTVDVFRVSIPQMLAALCVAIANAILVKRPLITRAAFLRLVALAVRVIRPNIPRTACFVIVFALAVRVFRPKDIVNMRAAFLFRVARTFRIIFLELAF
jgi:hypothetical protein